MPDSLNDPFWEMVSLDHLEDEQGVKPIVRVQDVLGRGQTLWGNDDEFDGFLASIQDDQSEGTSA